MITGSFQMAFWTLIQACPIHVSSKFAKTGFSRIFYFKPINFINFAPAQGNIFLLVNDKGTVTLIS